MHKNNGKLSNSLSLHVHEISFHHVLASVVLFLFLAWLSEKTFAASFSCQMASTSAENRICGDPELYSLDEKLTAAYQHAHEIMAEKDVIKGSQWRWLEEIRESCRDEKYLKAAYRTRLDLLSQIRPERSPTDSTVNVNLLSKYKSPGPEGKLEIHGYPSTDSRLDYAGNDLIIRVHATATGMVITPGFKLNNVYQIIQDRFAFNDRMLCTSDLIAKGFDLEGIAKSEIILGTNVTDRITGHAGNDTLNGGDGDDTYYYGPGDGMDCISDSSGNDTIEFTNGLTAKNVIVLVSTRENRSVAQLRLFDGKGQIQDNGIDILLDAKGNSPIELIRFSDGQSLRFAEFMRSHTESGSAVWDTSSAATCFFDPTLALQAGLVNTRAQPISRPPMPTPIRVPADSATRQMIIMGPDGKPKSVGNISGGQ